MFCSKAYSQDDSTSLRRCKVRAGWALSESLGLAALPADIHILLEEGHVTIVQLFYLEACDSCLFPAAPPDGDNDEQGKFSLAALTLLLTTLPGWLVFHWCEVKLIEGDASCANGNTLCRQGAQVAPSSRLDNAGRSKTVELVQQNCLSISKLDMPSQLDTYTLWVRLSHNVGVVHRNAWGDLLALY